MYQVPVNTVSPLNANLTSNRRYNKLGHLYQHCSRLCRFCCRGNDVTQQCKKIDGSRAFTLATYTKSLAKFHISSTGTHHHKPSKPFSPMSKTWVMMLHAAIHWVDVADPSPWPMTVHQVIYIWNCMPSIDTGLFDIFS
jgi:hypothetical protein